MDRLARFGQIFGKSPAPRRCVATGRHHQRKNRKFKQRDGNPRFVPCVFEIVTRRWWRRPVSSTEDIMNQWTNAKLCDVGNLILGGILFFSPWIFKFPAG